MLKIAITGSHGLVGNRILELLGNTFEFIELELPKFDITVKEKVIETINSIEFDILLHLAAYTSVEGAEIEKEKAWKINVEGTENIFNAVSRKKKKLIYISTDFVFDGIKPPFYEDSPVNPLGYYAKTKFEGEKIVKDEAMIVRIAYPYRAKFDLKKDLVRKIKSDLEAHKTLNMVDNSLITPTFIDDIAFSLKYLFNHFSKEIFHIVGNNSLSPFQVTKMIAKTFNLDGSLIKSANFKEYSKNIAQRPKLSEIKTKKNNFYKMKSFEAGLREVKHQMLIGK